MLLSLLFQLIAPTAALANTGNEQQAEFGAGGGGGEMVNMYTGALNYSIPLMSIPGPNIGYNITLSYNSDEAKMMSTPSCVGFGWTLNIGSISRQVQAIPDDFNGSLSNNNISNRVHSKPYEMYDLGLGELSNTKFFGVPIDLGKVKAKPAASYTGHVYWDNYTGLGLRVGISAPIPKISGVSGGLEYDTKRGVGYHLSGNLGFISATVSGNMIKGVSGLNFGIGAEKYSAGMSGGVGIAFDQKVPFTQMAMKTNVTTGRLRLGIYGFPPASGIKKSKIESGRYYPGLRVFENKNILGSYKFDVIKSHVERGEYTSKPYGYLYKGQQPSEDNSATIVKDFIKYPLSYVRGTMFLPSSQLGTDVFIQSDQGSGGVFTARTKDFDVWSSSGVYSNTSSLTIGGEFGKGVATSFHIGVNVLAGSGSNYSGSPIKYNYGWGSLINTHVPSVADGSFTKDASGNNVLNYAATNSDRIPLIKSSEIQIERNDVLALWGEGEGRAFGLRKEGNYFKGGQKYKLSGTLEYGNAPQTGFSKKRIDDFKQQSYVQYLSTEEALRYGKSKGFGYLKNTLAGSTTLQSKRAGHIAEINVYETSGLVYTYSEPVYNISREDASFSLQYENGGIEGVEINEDEKYLPSGNKSGSEVTYGKAKPHSAGHSGMEVLNVTNVPGYATSWPVTMVSSSDYVDLTGNGPSDDDLGSWVKFHYTKTHGGKDERNNDLPLYKWRSPYNKVQVMDGVKGESGDDMGSYRYGEKEVKYVDSIETKTHLAVFEYEDREDGFPVLNKLGGNSSNLNRDNNGNPLKRLKSIKLYLKRSELSKSDANYYTLLQTVNLGYDYSLCPNTPDNRGDNLTTDIDGDGKNDNYYKGKLTLKTLHSTFQQSTKGENYKYEFSYGAPNDASVNPEYNASNVDRWGDFKLNKNGNNPVNAGYPFQDFAYTEEASSLVAPWCLRSVALPTGALMSFEFEARDYAYVEDKAATKMYDIVSFSGNNSLLFDDIQSESNDLAARANRNAGSNYEDISMGNKNHIAIKLDPSDFANLNSTLWDDIFYKKYVEGLEDKIYMKGYVFLNNIAAYGVNPQEKDFDYVEAMGRLNQNPTLLDPILPNQKNCRVTKIGNDYYGVLQLHKENTQGLVNGKEHPLRAAAFEHIKTKRSEILYGRVSDGFGTGILSAVNLLYASIQQGQTALFIDEVYATKVRTNGWSKVRLKDPHGKKQGGGYRIKSITLNDNWRGANSNESYSYKQAYDYTIKDNDSIIKSSGVAMEPFAGREEDPRYLLYYYDEKIPSLEGNKHCIGGSPLDMHNTSASVGYRKVTVRNIYPTTVNAQALSLNAIQLSVAPHTEYIFNTPREYPTILKTTSVTSQDNQINYPISLNGFFSRNIYDNAISQGHTIIKNDMAGKLRSITQYTRSGNVISSQEYEYFQDVQSVTDYSYKSNFEMDSKAKPVDHLTNKNIPTLNSGINDTTMKFQVENVRVGEDYDIWMDVNDNHEEMNEIGFVDASVGFSFPSVVPIQYIMPLVFIPQNYSDKSDKQVVLTKVISRRGILKQVKTQKDQSKIRTEYLAYDQETAAPLLTRVDNEWHNINAQMEDDAKTLKEPRIYKFTRPAYWEYKSMAAGTNSTSPFLGVYRSIDRFYSTLPITNVSGNYQVNLPANTFSDGDVLAYATGANGSPVLKAYVNVDPVTKVAKLYTEDYSSVITSDIYNVRVIESGNSNLVNTTVGEVVFKELKLKQDSTMGASDYLNLSAITFASNWPKYCCYGSTSTLLNNPYLTGERNRWLPYQSFVYHGNRLYTNPSYSQRGLISVAGLTQPNLMYSFNWPLQSGYNWVLSSKAVRYDLFGNLIEQKDALGLPATSIFGYGRLLPIGVVSNSFRVESGVEDFEQKGYDNCGNTGNLGLSDTLNSSNSDVQISSEKSHTGKYSLKVLPGKTFELIKTTECQ